MGPSGADPGGSQEFVLHTVTRQHWEARDGERSEKLDNVPKLPYKLVLDHYTYTDPCNTPDECVRAVQTMQEKDMSRGYNDIRFNFLIGGDGNTYEGRGWNVCASRTLPSVIKIWRRRLDIAFVGDYSEKPIPDVMMQKFREIIEFGIKKDLILRPPISYHMRKGIQVLPVETTMDDFVGNVILELKKQEDETDEVLRDKREREKAVRDQREADNTEETRKKNTEKEIPYSDCPCESHHKKKQEDEIFRNVDSKLREELMQVAEFFRNTSSGI